MGYFDHIEKLPADPILELMWDFRRDTREGKVDLSVGIFYDDNLKSEIFPSVKKAENILFEKEKAKTYLPIDGDAAFVEETKKIVFGESLLSKYSSLIYGAQSVGGTGALRVAADFLSKSIGSSIYVSDPTWDNHFKVFHAASLCVEIYPYYDFKGHKVDFSKMLEFIKQIPQKSIVLLHACCHNPTGADLTKEQWMELSSVMLKHKLIPFFDMAYQGFGDGLEEDAFSVRYFLEQGHQMLIAFSYSKIAGLYAERVGAVFFVGSSLKEVEAAASQIKVIIRSNYSNPPKHGAAILSTLFTDPLLKKEWEKELNKMRERIQKMREEFASDLIKRCDKKDYSYLLSKKGMFCFTDLTKDQVQKLRDEYAIYMTKTGRINLSGLIKQNMRFTIDSILSVM